jgi:hypothetical protein
MPNPLKTAALPWSKLGAPPTAPAITRGDACSWRHNIGVSRGRDQQPGQRSSLPQVSTAQ